MDPATASDVGAFLSDRRGRALAVAILTAGAVFLVLSWLPTGIPPAAHALLALLGGAAGGYRTYEKDA